jgi:hypothetical protein
MNKKYLFLTTTVSTAIIFLFTNMTSYEPQQELSVQQIVEQSQHLSRRMKSREFSRGGKKMLARQKRAITRYLALKAKPESCQKLLELDGTLLTGTYELFPEGSMGLYHCKVDRGAVVNQVEVVKPESSEQTAVAKEEVHAGVDRRSPSSVGVSSSTQHQQIDNNPIKKFINRLFGRK